jgi:hypothetical protein
MSKEGTTKKESATPGTERKSRVGSLDFCCWRPFAAMFLRIEFFSFDERTTKCKSVRTVVGDYKPFRENLRLNRSGGEDAEAPDGDDRVLLILRINWFRNPHELRSLAVIDFPNKEPASKA